MTEQLSIDDITAVQPLGSPLSPGYRELCPTTDPHDVKVRAECATAGHPGNCHNPWYDLTFCRCGGLLRAGNVAPFPKSRMPVGGWASLARGGAA